MTRQTHPIWWHAASLGELTKKLVDGSHNPPSKQTDGLPMLSAVNIFDNNIHFSTYRLIKEADFVTEDSRTRIQENDVLLTIVGAIGRVAVVPKGVKPFTLQRSVAVLTPIEINSKFLMYQLESPRIANFFSKNARGTAQKGVYLKTLASTDIWFPSISEQHRIVARIEALFSELDKGIEALKTAREQLKVYRQAVLKHAFEGKLTAQWREENNHEPWVETTLGTLLSFLTSGSRGWAKYYANEGDIFIRAQNLKHDRLELDDVAYVRLPEKSEGMRTRVQAGDILVTITGANVTKTAFVQKDLGNAYVSQHVALCRPIEGADTEYLYWYLIAEVAGRRQLNEFAYGAGKPGLNLDNIRSVTVSLPGIEEQKQVVDVIKNLLSEEEYLDSTLSDELKRIETLRQSILKKAFAGQLVPQDPNDEPASVLLERIRAEKAAQAKTKLKKPARKKAV